MGSDDAGAGSPASVEPDEGHNETQRASAETLAALERFPEDSEVSASPTAVAATIECSPAAVECVAVVTELQQANAAVRATLETLRPLIFAKLIKMQIEMTTFLVTEITKLNLA